MQEAFFDTGKEIGLNLNIIPLMGEVDLTYPQVITGASEYYIFEAVGHGAEKKAEVLFTRVKDHCIVREGKEYNKYAYAERCVGAVGSCSAASRHIFRR